MLLRPRPHEDSQVKEGNEQTSPPTMPTPHPNPPFGGVSEDFCVAVEVSITPYVRALVKGPRTGMNLGNDALRTAGIWSHIVLPTMRRAVRGSKKLRDP